jgi:hypothetical protein
MSKTIIVTNNQNLRDLLISDALSLNNVKALIIILEIQFLNPIEVNCVLYKCSNLQQIIIKKLLINHKEVCDLINALERHRESLNKFEIKLIDINEEAFVMINTLNSALNNFLSLQTCNLTISSQDYVVTSERLMKLNLHNKNLDGVLLNSKQLDRLYSFWKNSLRKITEKNSLEEKSSIVEFDEWGVNISGDDLADPEPGQLGEMMQLYCDSPSPHPSQNFLQ